MVKLIDAGIKPKMLKEGARPATDKALKQMQNLTGIGGKTKPIK